MKINNQSGRILVRMNSQEIDEFQERMKLSAARTQNEDRKVNAEFGNMSYP